MTGPRSGSIPVSIIIPVFNGDQYVGGCIEALMNQEDAVYGRDYEIVVVDDGSGDKTLETARKFPVTVVGFPENKGRIFARKRGAEEAKFETLLFVDVKVEAAKDMLKNFWNIKTLPLMYGRMLDLERKMTDDERFFFLIRNRYYAPYFVIKEPVFITKDNFDRMPKGTTCLFMRKDMFLKSIPEEFGKFTSDDTKLLRNIVFQQGAPILRDPAIVITYEHRTKGPDLAKWVRWRGMSFYDYYVQRSLFLKIALPILFLLGIIAFIGIVKNIHAAIWTSLVLATLYLGISAYFCENIRDLSIVLSRLWKYIFNYAIGVVNGWVCSLTRHKVNS